jgi:flavin-dependent dehydrogenase
VIAKDTVNIVGAGPAGLTAAIVLRRHGYPVRVCEAAANVGHRLNGDFQGLENWSSERDVSEVLSSIGIELNFFCEPSYGSTIYAPRMLPVETTSERPVFYLVKRGPMPGTLDMGLKEQALSLGAEILFNHHLDTFDGRAIVGIGPMRADAVAAGMTFDTDKEDSTVVVLDDELAPRGYAYLLVRQGHGTMATILYRDFKKANECFDRTLRFFRHRMPFEMKNERRFGSFVNFFLRDTQVHEGKLFVGESAGFQDCLWGFGMRYAFMSGYLAAKSIIDGSDYDSLWKRQLRPMLETSLVNRYLLETFGHAAYRYLTRRCAQGDPRLYLQKHYNASFVKRLLLPLARRKYHNRIRDIHFGRVDEQVISAGVDSRRTGKASGGML